MEFFDGRQEGLSRCGRGWLGKDELRGVFDPGQTRLTMALSHAWITLLLILAFFIPWTLGALIFGFLESVESGLSCFLVMFFLIVVIVGIPSVILVFLSMLVGSSKKLKRNRIHLCDEFVEVIYWKGEKDIPVQVTRVPFRYIKDIHPVTDLEWNHEMKMWNPLRKIALWPFIGPSSRFQPGTRRKNVYTIEFDRRMELHTYSETQATWATLLGLTVSWLFFMVGREIEDQMLMDDKLYISMPGKDYPGFKGYVNERMKGPTAHVDRTYYQPEVHQPIVDGPIDDSSYMDLVYREDNEINE
ncbi:MAG: hypothetical protein ACMUHM_09115 [Thermoplasmatota archaeon]